MENLSSRAVGYGIPGVTVEGNTRDVYIEAVKAINRARDGKGPTLLECMWHRWTGHSISDADIYRTDKERQEGEKKCPVARFKRELISEGIVTEKDCEGVEKRVKDEIDGAVYYCEHECTDPDPEDILRGVYSGV